ncbi:MAG: ABC transporter ATP-binding protein [Fusobacteriaceae bacterium]|nr:ABC transporter ATP-binding protein [Fusobacteriaceae bacterium]
MIIAKNIHKYYIEKTSLFSKNKKDVLKGVSFTMAKGKCIGLIGESGSGKSTLGRIILGIEKPSSGEILLEKNTKISVVFQDYTSSVNPSYKVKDIIEEALSAIVKNSKEREKEIINLLDKVGLNETFINRYPHELSGGQLQRVCIARAISIKPDFILLDEAVSSLDINVQVQILDLLKKLKVEDNLSYLFITHDLMTITYLCDSVIFFKDGKIVEEVNDVNKLNKIKNNYSKELFNAVKELEIN